MEEEKIIELMVIDEKKTILHVVVVVVDSSNFLDLEIDIGVDTHIEIDYFGILLFDLDRYYLHFRYYFELVVTRSKRVRKV